METFIYILKSIAILSIFYIIYRIVLQKDTFFSANRHYLLSGIIASLSIPFIEYTKTIYKDIPILNTPIIEDTSFVTTAVTTIQPQQQAITIDWWEVALIVYAIGFTIMIVRLGIQIISLHRLIIAYPKTHKDGYTYVQITDKAITPFSFFKTICYNPNLHSSKELEMILAHEKIHVRQRHTLDILLTQCMLTIQWINPLAWLYKKSLEQNLEFIADNGAIQEVSSSQEYQHTLVKVSSTILQPALTNNFYHSLIKKRIVMLNKQTSRKRNLWKLGLILPALALFMYSFNVKEVITYREVTLDTEFAFAKAETEIIHKDNTKVIIEETPIANNLHPIDTGIHTPKLSSTNEKKQFIITKESTDQQLKYIEAYFKNTFKSTQVRFTKVNHIDNKLVSFDFQTKMANDNRFFTRFSVANTKNLSSFSLVAAAEHEIFKMDEGGSKIKFTPEQSLTTFSTFQESLGKHPALIVNGKLIGISEGETTYDTEGEIRIEMPKKAIALYGSQAKDGALVIEDPNYTTKVNGKYLKTPSDIANKTNVVFAFKVRITKNTTDQELEKIKKDLKKDHNVDFNYTATRNIANEITGITIKYKTARNNSGNYSVSSDSPISDIYIYEDENGATGISNVKSQQEIHKKQKELSKKMKERLEERQEQLDVMQQSETTRSEEIKKHLEKRQAELEKNRAKQQGKFKERREQLEEKREEMHTAREKALEEKRMAMEQKREKMLQKRTEINQEVESGYEKINGETVYFINKNGKKQYYDGFGNLIDKDGNKVVGDKQGTDKKRLFINSSGLTLSSEDEGGYITLIKSTMASDEIKNIEHVFNQKNIKYSYSNLKRNTKGEITRITIQLKDANGNKSKASFGNSKSAIPIISLGYVGY